MFFFFFFFFVFCLEDRALKECISGVVIVEMVEEWLSALSVE